MLAPWPDGEPDRPCFAAARRCWRFMTRSAGAASAADREAQRDDAVFEDAAATVGQPVLAVEAFERAGKRLRLPHGAGRQILHEVVAKPVPGHEISIEAARLGDRSLALGHRPHVSVGAATVQDAAAT